MTLRESIYMTKRLGIRYLWIDALRVIQASETGLDEQRVKNGLDYGNATFNTSAASTASCTHGVLPYHVYQHWKLPSKLTPDHTYESPSLDISVVSAFSPVYQFWYRI
jgi:hypothetical protein